MHYFLNLLYKYLPVIDYIPFSSYVQVFLYKFLKKYFILCVFFYEKHLIYYAYASIIILVSSYYSFIEIFIHKMEHFANRKCKPI